MDFKEVLKEEGLSIKEFAELLGMNTKSVYVMLTRRKGNYPKWAKAFILGYKIGKGIW